MKKEQMISLLNYAMKQGATFSDIFFEDTIERNYFMQDRQLDKISNDLVKGVGIRIVYGEEVGYTYTNDLSEKNLYRIIDELQKCYDSNQNKVEKTIFDELEECQKVKIPHDKKNSKWKKDILLKIDKIARDYSDLVIQVKAQLMEEDQRVTIINSDDRFVRDKRTRTRLAVTVITEKDGKKSSSNFVLANGAGYELLEDIDLESKVKETVDLAIEGINAKDCPGGRMPVIIENGFGAVILHEACGHAMEADSVSKNLSILSGKLGEKIASSKVTVFDDGTIPNEWGSLTFDDEGNPTQKNLLVEKGILKGYLIDRVNQEKMNMPITGSGRRENYCYSPTSRMNNTYIENGEDSIEDMIKSIDFGLYIKSFVGGSVEPVTGEFNFSASEAYLIEKGKITDRVKGASLIGNSLEILQNIEMVSNNKELGHGLCGANSGWVPVGCGQPTIKVSSILVGGAS